jgi:hypothetical protein
MRRRAYIARLGDRKNFGLLPGMPADVHVKACERRFSNSIVRIVLDSFSRAFREP